MGNKTKQVEVNAKIDAGVMSNFLPLTVFTKLQDVQLEKTPVYLFAFVGTTIFTGATFHMMKTNEPMRVRDVQETRLGDIPPRSTNGQP